MGQGQWTAGHWGVNGVSPQLMPHPWTDHVTLPGHMVTPSGVCALVSLLLPGSDRDRTYWQSISLRATWGPGGECGTTPSTVQATCNLWTIKCGSTRYTSWTLISPPLCVTPSKWWEHLHNWHVTQWFPDRVDPSQDPKQPQDDEKPDQLVCDFHLDSQTGGFRGARSWTSTPALCRLSALPTWPPSSPLDGGVYIWPQIS